MTIPSQVSHLVVRRAIAAARQAEAPLLGLVENMARFISADHEDSLELFPYGQGETFATEVDIPYLGQVPFDSGLARTTDAGRPFVLEHSETLAGQAILNLTKIIEESLESK